MGRIADQIFHARRFLDALAALPSSRFMASVGGKFYRHDLNPNKIASRIRRA